jgi:hypothetical protein
MLAFLVLGALFGLLSYSHRHLFGEGPSVPKDSPTTSTHAGRLVWILVCSALWPLLALTGLYSLWLLARRRKAAAEQARD